METTSDVEAAQNSTNDNKEYRLLGGADAEELREILKDTDTTITPSKTSQQQAEPHKEALSKKQLAFKYTRMTILVSVVLFSIVLLARVTDGEENFMQIAIATNAHRKAILIANKSDGRLREIGVQIRGPFEVQDSLHVEKEKLYVKVRIANGEKLKSISDTKEFLLVSPNQFDKVEMQLKQHTYPLDEYNENESVYLSLEANDLKAELGLAVRVDTTPILTSSSLIFGITILIFLYFMIVTEVVDRTFAALVCAALSLGALAFYDCRPSSRDIIHWIDVDTLALLVGMMILVAILAESGIFDYFAVFAFKIAKGRPWPLINCLCLFTALLATFLDSVTMMLLATPVTIRLCEVLSLDPVPILICMVIFANVGAAVTPIGDPPNVIITLNSVIAGSGIDFSVFVLHMLPGVVLGLIQCYIHIRLLFRKPESLQFPETDELKDLRQEIATWERQAAAISPYSQDEDIAREAIDEKIAALKKKLNEAEERGTATKEKPTFEETLTKLTALYPLRDKMLLIKAGITFVFMIVLFLGHSAPSMKHISLGWAALVGAFLLMVLADKRILEIILVRIEWSTLLFFASLFVVMESLAKLGVIQLIGRFVTQVILSVDEKYRLLLAIVLVLWVTAIASAFLDNIPVTTMMVKIIIDLSQDHELNLPLHPLVWSLAFGACFGGNGTLIGASANVVTAGVSEQHGYKIKFMKFFIVCFPIMLGSVAVANIYLLIAHVAFAWHDK